MLHLYAITDCPRRRLPPVRALDDAPLERVTERGVSGIYTQHRAPIDASEDVLWRHEEVVERLMADRAVLPVRFGAAFSDVRDLRREIRTRAGAFAETLAYVRGRVELGVRVLSTRNGEPETPLRLERHGREGGRAYLAARLAERAHAREVADAVHEPLAAAAVASRQRLFARERLLSTAAYLVERESVRTFTETLERVQAEHPELAVLCTGPWPPYNFVDTPPVTS